MRIKTQLLIFGFLFGALLVAPYQVAYAACANPVGSAGDIIYNSDHKVIQFCDDTDWISAGSAGVAGITSETDPTVPANIKDGIAWGELSGIPAGFADGTDDGITSETDPTVPANVKDGVAWGELSGIPGGFADGVDNTGGGGFTTCTTVSTYSNAALKYASRNCNGGWTMTGGGCRGTSASSPVDSYPSGNGWFCSWAGSSGMYIYARCCQ